MQTFTKQVAHPATLVFANRRPTFEEAKSICRGKVSSYKSYYAFRKNNPQYNLPSQPMVYYKTEWTNIYEFLAIYPSVRSEGVRKYWADVKSGVRTRTLPPKKKKNSNTYKISSTPTIQDKKMFIDMAKALGVYDQVKPAFKTLFTYDELLELVTL